MASVRIRDESRAGHPLGGAELSGLPRRASLRQLLHSRIHGEVEAYNDDPGRVFRGFVQPADSVRHSDGFRLREPRPLEAEVMVAAAEAAVARGLVTFRIGDTVTQDLEMLVDVSEVDEVVALFERPVVAPSPE